MSVRKVTCFFTRNYHNIHHTIQQPNKYRLSKDEIDKIKKMQKIQADIITEYKKSFDKSRLQIKQSDYGKEKDLELDYLTEKSNEHAFKN